MTGGDRKVRWALATNWQTAFRRRRRRERRCYSASVAYSGGRHASTGWVSPRLRLSGLALGRRPPNPARLTPQRYGDDCRQVIGETPSRARLPCGHDDDRSPGRVSINQPHAKTTDAALHKSAACVAELPELIIILTPSACHPPRHLDARPVGDGKFSAAPAEH